jgi:hypothetical protein
MVFRRVENDRLGSRNVISKTQASSLEKVRQLYVRLTLRSPDSPRKWFISLERLWANPAASAFPESEWKKEQESTNRTCNTQSAAMENIVPYENQ